MATIGRNAAVTELPNGARFKGVLAWYMWLLLHLAYIVGFRSRIAVLVNWIWSYLTYDRHARIIVAVEPTRRAARRSRPAARPPGGLPERRWWVAARRLADTRPSRPPRTAGERRRRCGPSKTSQTIR